MHLAISILLMWLAINIAFVVLRLRAAGTGQLTPSTHGRAFRLHPRARPFHHP